ncbi:MAG: hypothetical protein KF781_00655 [Chitinophagaceae bacterium]|nr:hypothetical protein [Chitinophagaceae bacterium]MCW5905244.1 hypothetical protein [Chitinophagaceae bacterium]
MTPNNQKYTKEINVNYSLLYELTVENNTDNIFTLSNVLIKAKASMIYDNEEIIYNSEKPNPTNQLTKRFDELLNEPFYYTFQNGCCIKRKNDHIRKKYLSYLTGSPDLEMFNEFVESLFIALPNDLKLKTVFNSNTTIIPSDSDNAYIQFKTESIKGVLLHYL